MGKRFLFLILSAILFSYSSASAKASKSEVRAEISERISDWNDFSKEVVTVSESLKSSNSKITDCLVLGELMGLAFGYFHKWELRINSGLEKFGLQNTGSYVGNFEAFISGRKNVGYPTMGYFVTKYCKDNSVTKELVIEQMMSLFKNSYNIDEDFFCISNMSGEGFICPR